jgi:hypothetical protein
MNDRLASPAAAKYVGVSPSTWRAYVSRGQAPGPDGKDEAFDRDYWLTSTLDAFKANRKGQGARTDLPKAAAAARKKELQAQAGPGAVRVTVSARLAVRRCWPWRRRG